MSANMSSELATIPITHDALTPDGPPARSATDTRIANVLAMLDNWHAYSQLMGADSTESYVEQLIASMETHIRGHDELRAMLTLLMTTVVDDGQLSAMSKVADGEREIYLQCTIGNEISDALQKSCGLNANRAEKIAHEAIRSALDIVDGDPAGEGAA